MKSDWEHLSAPVDTVTARLRAAELPSMNAVRALATWDASLLGKFERTTEDLATAGVDRSGAMAELSYLMAEHGWNDEQIYVGVQDADERWGKFVGRSNRETILMDLVNRARAKVGYRTGDPAEGIRATIARLEGGSPVPNGDIRNWVSFAAERHEVVWQLEGIMPVRSLGLLVASPGTGKTQMLMHLGAEMATGADQYLTWRNLGQIAHRVLFLSFEMGEDGVHLFITQMDRAYQHPAKQQRLKRNFMLEPVGEAFPLDIAEGQEWFDDYLARAMPDVVLIDSLSMIVSKEMTDEVAVKDMFKFLKTMREKHNCSMLVVHHDRKQGTDTKKEKTTLDDIYGSRFITASVDYALYLNKVTDDRLNLTTLKNRYHRADHKDELIRTGDLTFHRNTQGVESVVAAAEKLTHKEIDPFAGA